MTSLVDVVVVNWNSAEQLADCLRSVKQWGGKHLGNIIVVDNGSVDGSLGVAQLPGPTAITIDAKENLGFSRACNLGARHGSAEYILFLNPDARLSQGTIPTCMSFFDSEAAHDIGIVGPKLLSEEGCVHRHCARFPTWKTYFGKATGLSQLFPSHFPSHFMTEFDHQTSRRVDEVIGAAFLVRRVLFDDLSGFDERYFVYFEELDFALRARACGWGTYYLSEAIAYHRGGGSSDQVKPKRLFYSMRSRIIYAFKNFSRTDALLVLVTTAGLEVVSRLLRAIVKASLTEFADTLKAYAMLYAALPSLLPSVWTIRRAGPP